MSEIIINQDNYTYSATLTMANIICCNCGIPFAVPQDFKTVLHRTQDYFYCPRGHRQHYSKSTEQILRERLEKQEKDAARVAQELQEAANAWRQEWGKQVRAKKTVERKLNRVMKGICPCCNRHFNNLDRHMANQHPEESKRKPEQIKNKKQKV